MAQEAPSESDRIERAFARIGAAIQRRGKAHDTLIQRHAVLRERVSDAIDAIEAMIGEEPA